jgi:hypothetical protein
MKQRYKAMKIGGFLNDATLEYDADRWCVLDGADDDAILAECYDSVDARRIVWALNFTDKVAIAVNKKT